MKIGVIDYGVGNLGSVIRALEELRADPILLTCPGDMHNADGFILPGVGNFTECMNLLNNQGWTQSLKKEVQGTGKPLLGVCLGMQLLASFSSEGAVKESADGTAGLGFIPGRVENLRTLGCKLRVPHVGWNEVINYSKSGGLFSGIPENTDFYFVHSFAFIPKDTSHILATVNYGIEITAAVRSGTVWGTQFHPEKSSRAGFQLLRNFIENPIC